MIDPNSLKVPELKAELAARGLSTKGLKKELVVRLEEALAAEGTTVAPTESTSEPDVAPKEANPDRIDESTEAKEDLSSEPTTTASEVQEIVKIVEPVVESVVADETEIIMTEVPEPAVTQENVSEFTTVTLEPVVGTPSLLQEGFIDTTTASSSTDQLPLNTKKRSLESDETSSQKGSASESSSTTVEKPPKRIKAIEIDREQSEQVAAAARDSLEADARRRSAAPSPSPALGRSGSTASIPVVPTIAEEDSKQLSASAPRPSDDDRKLEGIAGRRFDAKTMIERVLQPQVPTKPTALSFMPKSSVTVEESIEGIGHDHVHIEDKYYLQQGHWTNNQRTQLYSTE